MDSRAKQNYLFELKALDWSFDGATSDDGLGRYHWYPARYVSHVPGVLIAYCSEPGDLVVDPFCGSGTTLVEGVRQGRRVAGIDTNPVATMMAEAKLVPLEGASWNSYTNGLLRTIANLRLAQAGNNAWLAANVPSLDEQSAWYHDETLFELATIWYAICSTSDAYQPIARVAFSAILRFACSQDKHWGWICDNVKPKTLNYKPATKLFIDKLRAFPDLALKGPLRIPLGKSSAEPFTQVSHGRCQDVLPAMTSEKADLIVTSPPYFSMTDYVRSQRLTFLWFGWDLDRSRANESGARYKRHRLQARGEYLSEMADSLKAMVGILKPGGLCCVVIGESPNRAAFLDDYRDLMVAAGLKIEARINRRVATQRSFSPQLKHEEIIISRRESDDC